MKAILEYWDRISYYSGMSEVKKHEIIQAENKISLFEKFYSMNNRLRYCNGSYYKFQDPTLENEYRAWLNSDDYKEKSFQLYYGNGIVD